MIKLPYYVPMLPATEEKYKEISSKQFLPFLRIAIAFGLIAFPVWLIHDYFVFDVKELDQFVVRISNVPILLISFLLAFHKNAYKFNYILTIVTLTAVNLQVVYSNIYIEQYFTDENAYLFVFLLLPLMPFYSAAAWTVFLGGVLSNVLIFADGNVPPTNVATFNFNYWTGGILCIMLSYIAGQFRRASYLTEKNLAEAKVEAEAANAAKSTFLATMSHEVRTPLNGILGIVELLKDTKLNENQYDQIETIRYSGETLLTILNDVLDFSKMEAGKFEVEYIDFDLNRLVQSIVALMQSRAEENGIKLFSDIDGNVPRYIKSDPTRLRQVLLNLVSNAIKFTDDGNIQIRVINTGELGSNAELRFEVIDTGIGISKEAQEKLFDEFSQVDSSVSRKYGGTGLGLAICKKIIDLFNGKIGIDSEEGHGSTFYFEIPVEIAEADEVAGEKAEGVVDISEIRPLNILVVEDNKINQKVVTGLLERKNHNITIAENGAEAVSTLKNDLESFDLVLMDMQMPVLDGLGATKKIRAMGGPYLDIPIIALTANAIKGDREKCLAAGMNDYVSKPIIPQDLYNTIAWQFPDDARSQEQTQPPREHPDDTMPGQNVIDFSILTSIEDVMGKDYMGKFIDDSLEELQRLIDELENIQDNDKGVDEERVTGIAHDFKSLSGMLGMVELGTLAESIESCYEKSQIEEAQTLSRVLKSRFNDSLPLLKEVLKNNSASHYA